MDSLEPTWVFVVAMPVEAEAFIKIATQVETLKLSPRSPVLAAYRCVFQPEENPNSEFSALLLTSGIGLVAAALTLQWALDNFKVQAVISAGTAGGLKEDSEVGQVCVSTQLRYGHADATAFGYAVGQVPGQPEFFTADATFCQLAKQLGKPVRLGEMLSGDTFVTSAQASGMRELFAQAVTTDMESTALAQGCYKAGIPFVSVRGISDLCGPRSDQEHHLSAEITSELSAQTVLKLVSAYRREIG